MKLNQMRDVVTVAQRGSIRAAARHLGIAQPALTRSIHELERELGVTLFERQAKGIVVTPVGEAFVRRALAVQVEMQRARDEIDQLRGMTHGRLAVCLSSVPQIALLPYALPAFRTRYPDVLVDMREGLFPTIESSLRAGILDIYVGPPPAEALGGDLVTEQLFVNTRVIVGRKGHPLMGARSLRELVHAQWLSTSVFNKSSDELGPLFAEYGLPAPRLALQAHSALTIIVAITSSDLLGMLPVQWMDFPLTRDALQRIEVAEVLPAPSICIVRRAGLPLTPTGEYFCDMVRRASGHLNSTRKARRQSPHGASTTRSRP